MKKIAILGSTGSIGTQTLEIVREQKDICVRALAAGNNIDLLEQQIREFHPVLASVQSEEKAADLRQRLRDRSCNRAAGRDFGDCSGWNVRTSSNRGSHQGKEDDRTCK